MVESLLPIVSRSRTACDGRERAGLCRGSIGRPIEPFRLMPGDDASCLNLYEPTESANPGADVPVSSLRDDSPSAVRWPRPMPSARIRGCFWNADSARWRRAGHCRRQLDDLRAPSSGRRRARRFAGGATSAKLRLVARSRDSIFQSELLMSEANFLKLFPRPAGLSLVAGAGARDRAPVQSPPRSRSGSPTSAPMRRARPSGSRQFHRVENTYLSTFQTLGGSGAVAGYRRAGRRAAQQRARAPARIGAARGRGISWRRISS